MKKFSDWLVEGVGHKRCNNCNTDVVATKRVCPNKKCKSTYFTPETEEQKREREEADAKAQETLNGLLEADHYLDYGKWGIITDKHKVIMGNSHPTATTHEELGYPKHKVEFAQDTEGGFLSLRTRGPESLALAIKHFPTLPHMRTGMVTHTHFGRVGMIEHSGKSHEVLAKMKELAAKK